MAGRDLMISAYYWAKDSSALVFHSLGSLNVLLQTAGAGSADYGDRNRVRAHHGDPRPPPVALAPRSDRWFHKAREELRLVGADGNASRRGRSGRANPFGAPAIPLTYLQLLPITLGVSPVRQPPRPTRSIGIPPSDLHGRLA